MTEQETQNLIRENERMKSALNAVVTYAAGKAFGAWRSDVVALARNGLQAK